MNWFRRRKANRRVRPEDEVASVWPRRLAIVAIGLLVAAAGTTLSWYLRSLEWERFQALEISGELERVSAGEVQEVLLPYIESGFARIDIRRAQQAVEALPWVADAALRREWPGTLVVELREEKPIATWFGTALLNASGTVFVDGAAGFSSLPDVGGPAGAQDVMIARLEEIDAAAERSGLQLRRLLRTERRAERMWLDNGIEVRLGRRDVDARLQRFLEVALPALRTRVEQVAYVDMRYTNGFAVGWKVGEANREKG